MMMTMTSFHIQSHSYSCIDNQSYWSKLVAHLLPLQTFSKFQPKHCSFGTWTYIRFNERRTWWGTFANRLLPFNYWLHSNSVVPYISITKPSTTPSAQETGVCGRGISLSGTRKPRHRIPFKMCLPGPLNPWMTRHVAADLDLILADWEPYGDFLSIETN